MTNSYEHCVSDARLRHSWVSWCCQVLTEDIHNTYEKQQKYIFVELHPAGTKSFTQKSDSNSS